MVKGPHRQQMVKGPHRRGERAHRQQTVKGYTASLIATLKPSIRNSSSYFPKPSLNGKLTSALHHSADGERATSPADGERATPPADGERATPPADGERATPPEVGEKAIPPSDSDSEAINTEQLKLFSQAQPQREADECANHSIDSVVANSDIQEPQADLNQAQEKDCVQATSLTVEYHESDCVQATSPIVEYHESDCVQATPPKDKDHESDCVQGTSPKDKDHESDCVRATSPKDGESERTQFTAPNVKDDKSDLVQTTPPTHKSEQDDLNLETHGNDFILQSTSSEFEGETKSSIPCTESVKEQCLSQLEDISKTDGSDIDKEETYSSDPLDREMVHSETEYKDKTSSGDHSPGKDIFKTAHEEVKSDSSDGLTGDGDIDHVPHSVTESEREISLCIAAIPVAGSSAIATPAKGVHSLDDNPAIGGPYGCLSIEGDLLPKEFINKW